MLQALENRQVYRPVKADQEWKPAPSPVMQDVELTGSNGTRLHAWWHPCPGSRDAILYFHGNAGNLSHRGGSVLKLADFFKTNVLIIDYPGYGKSQGSPSEMGCYAAGDAGYDWLVDEQKIIPHRILLYGASLGGGVAVDLASRREHRALVLVSTFTSMPDVGQHLCPWLPVRWFMRNRFNNLAKIEFCTRPVFIGNSPEDKMIPFSHGQKLFEAANEPKEFFVMKGGHQVGPSEDFFRALASFLNNEAP